MGFFDVLFGGAGGGRKTKNSKNDEDNVDEDAKVKDDRGFAFGDALVGSGRYNKDNDSDDDGGNKVTLAEGLGVLEIKMYNDDRQPSYDRHKKRLKVGQSFNVRNLPDLIYKIASKSGDFRKDIQYKKFRPRDRNEFRRVMRKRRRVVDNMKRTLKSKNENWSVFKLSNFF